MTFKVLCCFCLQSDLRTEHIICADKLVLAPNFYYSLATVCYVLPKSFNFWKYGILTVIPICVLIAHFGVGVPKGAPCNFDF